MTGMLGNGRPCYGLWVVQALESMLMNIGSTSLLLELSWAASRVVRGCGDFEARRVCSVRAGADGIVA